MIKNFIAQYSTTLEQAIASKSSNSGPIEELFLRHKGRPVHKWLQYLPVYDRFFAPLDKSNAVLLEIGVAGGSLEIWRQFFGEHAAIYGVDIDPACAQRVTPPNQVRIGSQTDPDFLRRVVDEMGRPNVVIDDGSHIAAHQVKSFRTLFPLVQQGGLYVIEDLHTAYWRGWQGGLRRAGTAIDLVKTLIDDQHASYHDGREVFAPRSEIGGIHIFDSIVVIEKADTPHPTHLVTGG